jgi:Nitrogen regulatory protein P-II
MTSEAPAMQMLMIVVESTHKEKVEAALSEHRVLGYTEIPTVYGMGQTGMRLGSRAFPETSSIIFTVLEKGKVGELLKAIDGDCTDCRAKMRMIVWEVQRIV